MIFFDEFKGDIYQTEVKPKKTFDSSEIFEI